MQQPPNPFPQNPQQQWQQQPNYAQPLTYYPLPPQQWNPLQPPQYQPPKKKSRKRLWLILAAVVLVLAVIIGVASQGQNQQPVPTTQATLQTRLTQQSAKQVPTPNMARLGGTTHDFDLKFGKEDTSNGGIGYQPFGSYTLGQDLPTDKFNMVVDNGRVEGVTVTLTTESPLNWQDGTKLCRSFLPTDAVFQSDEDFSPPTQEYQEMYMSKTMAHIFSANHFMAGRGVNPQRLTPGTVQIMYYYSSFYNHSTSGAQITSCDVELGQPN